MLTHQQVVASNRHTMMTTFSPNKRVLLVDLGATFGGAEVYLENLVRPLREHLDFYALCAHLEIAGRLDAMGVQVFSLPSSKGPFKVFQLFSALCVLPFLLLRYRIDTVQINGYSEVVLLPLARLLGRTAVATRHLSFDIEEHWSRAPGRFIARFLYRRLARFASRVVCVSQVVGDQVRPLVPANRVVVIPNWVDSIPPPKLKAAALGSPVNILYVGRLARYKGLHVLLDAIRHLGRNRRDYLLRLTVVGDGDYRTELERRAVGTDSHFVGFRPDVTPYYQGADIFVGPSLGPEGSPLVSLEAMAQGLPCIMSDLSVHREISEDGKAALLFRSGDPEDLAQKLEALIENDKQRTDLSQHAYLAVRRNHNPETAIESYLRAFEA